MNPYGKFGLELYFIQSNLCTSLNNKIIKKNSLLMIIIIKNTLSRVTCLATCLLDVLYQIICFDDSSFGWGVVFICLPLWKCPFFWVVNSYWRFRAKNWYFHKHMLYISMEHKSNEHSTKRTIIKMNTNNSMEYINRITKFT